MNDYVIALLWCAGVLFLLVFVPVWVGWALGRLRDRKPHVAPPEPERIDPPRRACVMVAGRISHEYRQIVDSEGAAWHVCGRCGEMVRRNEWSA